MAPATAPRRFTSRVGAPPQAPDPPPPGHPTAPPPVRLPAHWRWDPHNPSLRAARQGAARRLACRPRDVAAERLLRKGWTQGRVADWLTRLGEFGRVTRRMVQTAPDRLRRGNRAPRCAERSCGRSRAGPCWGRRWIPWPVYRLMGQVARLRERSRQRAAHGPSRLLPSPSESLGAEGKRYEIRRDPPPSERRRMFNAGGSDAWEGGSDAWEAEQAARAARFRAQAPLEGPTAS